MPEISIIIINYKSARLTRQCIKGIKKFPPKVAYEIIVIDNNSKDGIGEMLEEKYPDVVLKKIESNLGFGAGINSGIKIAQSEYLLILNPDILILENSIQSLYDFMKTQPDSAIAGPKLLNPDGRTQISCYKFHKITTPIYRRTPLGRLPWAKKSLQDFLSYGDKLNGHEPKKIEWLLGASMMLRKSALDKIGLFDEQFFLYFEDTELCRRAWDNGWKVFYVPNAQMVHYHMRESAEHFGLLSVFDYPTRIHIASWIKYLYKYWGKSTPEV